jgi:CheY-like chemotaxis protein
VANARQVTSRKALATKQPWASLIACGEKSIEVRTWFTHYRGPLVITASGSPNKIQAERFPDLEQPTSCLMTLVDLVDVRAMKRSDAKGAFMRPTDVDDSLFAWILENPRALVRTRYTKSRVSTFDLEDDVVIELAPASAKVKPPSAVRLDPRRTAKAPSDDEDDDDEERLPRFLVADDDALVREKVYNALRQWGGGEWDVYLASDGRDALDQIREKKPDVAVLDVMMPGRSGLEVANAIRKSKQLQQRTRVVLLGLDDQLRSSVDAIHRSVKKPIDMKALRVQVEEALDAVMSQGHIARP